MMFYDDPIYICLVQEDSWNFFSFQHDDNNHNKFGIYYHHHIGHYHYKHYHHGCKEKRISSNWTNKLTLFLSVNKRIPTKKKIISPMT